MEFDVESFQSGSQKTITKNYHNFVINIIPSTELSISLTNAKTDF